MTDLLLMVIVCTLLFGAAAVRTALGYLAGLTVGLAIVGLTVWGLLHIPAPAWGLLGSLILFAVVLVAIVWVLRSMALAMERK